MTQRSSAAPPLFGFRVGEVAQLHQGWGGRITPVRIVGPGSGGTSLAVDPTDPSVRPPRGADVDVWNLMHDTSAFRAWAVLWERSLNERALDPGRDRGAYLCALRRATEALIVENPQLLIPRNTSEGGAPHSWAVCHRAWLTEAEAGSPARLEQTIGAISDPQIVDHIRRSAGRAAEMDEMDAPWLEDEDRTVLRRIASRRR